MNFLGIGPGELVLILIIAVIVLGPDKIPDVMRQVGKTVRELRAMSEAFQNELRKEMYDQPVRREVRTAPMEVSSTGSTAGAPGEVAKAELAESPAEAQSPGLPPPHGPGDGGDVLEQDGTPEESIPWTKSGLVDSQPLSEKEAAENGPTTATMETSRDDTAGLTGQSE